MRGILPAYIRNPECGVVAGATAPHPGSYALSGKASVIGGALLRTRPPVSLVTLLGNPSSPVTALGMQAV